LRKAGNAAECAVLEQIPNIGRALAADLRLIGVATPADLADFEPLALYQALCQHSGQRQDPCVLDSFMAAVDFMRGASPTPWWHFTEARKHDFGRSSADLAGLKLAARMPKPVARSHGNISSPVHPVLQTQPD
jgi:hypothetical protein